MIPTLLIIVGVLFFFSKNHVVDTIEAELSGQFVDPDSDQYKKEYDRLYHMRGYDLPDFYFSIVPRYYPKRLNASEHRDAIRSELKSDKTLNTLSFTDKLPRFSWHGTENQFHQSMMGMLTFSSGTSIVDGKSAGSKIGSALKWTLTLIILNLIIAVMVAFPLGIWLYRKAHHVVGRSAEVALFLVYAMPVFWLATLMIIFFTTREYGSWTDIFPTVGIWDIQSSFFATLLANAQYLVLPIIIMVLHDIAFLSIMIKRSIEDEVQSPYTTALKAKGISDQGILRKHIIPNALSPILTVLSAAIPRGIAGSLVIEVIFNIPGMGRLLYESILKADWNVIFPIVLMMALLTMVFYLLYDVMIRFIRPSIMTK